MAKPQPRRPQTFIMSLDLKCTSCGVGCKVAINVYSEHEWDILRRISERMRSEGCVMTVPLIEPLIPLEERN